MIIGRMKKIVNNEIYKTALEYYKLLNNKGTEDTTVKQIQSKLLGMRKMAWALELLDMKTYMEIEEKAKADAAEEA